MRTAGPRESFTGENFVTIRDLAFGAYSWMMHVCKPDDVVRDSGALLCGRNLNTIEICVKRLLSLVES